MYERRLHRWANKVRAITTCGRSGTAGVTRASLTGTRLFHTYPVPRLRQPA